MYFETHIPSYQTCGRLQFKHYLITLWNAQIDSKEAAIDFDKNIIAETQYS